jgi:hypothetical protein
MKIIMEAALAVIHGTELPSGINKQIGYSLQLFAAYLRFIHQVHKHYTPAITGKNQMPVPALFLFDRCDDLFR